MGTCGGRVHRAAGSRPDSAAAPTGSTNPGITGSRLARSDTHQQSGLAKRASHTWTLSPVHSRPVQLEMACWWGAECGAAHG